MLTRVVRKIKKIIKNYRTSLIKSDTIHIHQSDTNNIGDLVCSPYLYFSELQANSTVFGIMFFSENDIPFKNKTIIVGGGGLLSPYFEKSIDNIIKLAKHNKVIFWGVGFNSDIHDNFTISEKDYDSLYAFSIRDFYDDNKYTYVPCVSCMSELLDRPKQNNIGEYGVYLHGNNSENIKDDLSHLPCLYNTHVNSFSEAVEFISSYNVILTNSYHGLYWATLLGKKVILLPWSKKDNVDFSVKFNGFPYKPYICNDWNDYKNINVEDIPSYPDSLVECRNINIQFFNSIKSVIKTK